MKHMIKSFIIGIILFSNTYLIAQEFPSGFDYQAILRNENGNPISNTEIDIEIGLYTGDANDILVWEEIQTSITNNDGYYQLIIGEGVATGQGLVNDFDAINWSIGDYSINIKIDQGQGYEDFGFDQLYSVPFAYYAKRAENQLFLNNMVDVDTNDISIGDILRYNGNQWAVFPYSDTVTWALNALSASYSQYSDTATIAIEALSCPPCDSAIFTFYGDSSIWSVYADTSNYSFTSSYADTALFALETYNTWKLDGNISNDSNLFFGTLDSSDVSIITNGSERMRIKADGNIGIGTSEPKYDLHVVGNNGVMFSGEFGSVETMLMDTGSATFWIPSKSAFRTGYVNNSAWILNNIGNYSFAGGYNNTAKGDYSFSFGEISSALGKGSVAIGYYGRALGDYSIAMGSGPTALGFNSIALGRGCYANDSTSIAMGYWARSTGKYAISMGYQSYSQGDYSVAFGFRANAVHEGAIVLSDKSSNTYTSSTTNNQFLVRAAGGTIIYSDAEMTTGVSLAAGSGSWSTLSDSILKENFKLPNIEQIVQKANELDVYSWNYIAQNDSIRHIGPMAQGFYDAFGLGENNKTISAVDFDGINFLLLKIIIEKEEELQLKISELNMYIKQIEVYEIQNKIILEKLRNNAEISSLLSHN